MAMLESTSNVTIANARAMAALLGAVISGSLPLHHSNFSALHGYSSTVHRIITYGSTAFLRAQKRIKLQISALFLILTLT